MSTSRGFLARVAGGVLAVLLILQSLSSSVVAAAPDADPYWQTIGRLPFEPTALTADGLSLYAAGQVDGRPAPSIRVDLGNGRLENQRDLGLPLTTGVITGLALDGADVYYTSADYTTAAGDQKVVLYRSNGAAEAGKPKVRSMDRIQALTNGTAIASFAGRIWISQAWTLQWLHWLETPRPGRNERVPFHQGPMLGPARPGAALIPTARMIYLLGGDGFARDVLGVPVLNGRLGTPRAMGTLPEAYTGGFAVVHGSTLYLIGAPWGEPRVDRATMRYDGSLSAWTRVVSPAAGPPPVAATTLRGQIVIARADGTVETLSVGAVSPGRRRIVWNTSAETRSIAPGQTLTEVIPWSYAGPEDIDDFSAWTYASGKASRLADRGASLAGTYIRAGGGTGRELVLVITVPPGSRRRDYWSIILLQSHGRSVGPVLRIHHRNSACSGILC
jgi:hypothetical protein